MIHVVEPWKLAKEFSRIISEWLTPEQLAEANRLNKTPEYTTNELCATHNYCDSNQAMIDALKAFGVEWDSDNIDLCNAAWSRAKAADFNPEHVRAEMNGLRKYDTTILHKTCDRGSDKVYSDWYADDEAAIAGSRRDMEAQGYTVAEVVLGFPGRITLE